MKICVKIIPALIAVLLLTMFSGCGYHNPNVYTGSDKVIYVPDWKNRTSKLNLDSDLYRKLTEWFQYSNSLSLTRDKAGADLILAGEIISIDLPSLAYNAANVAEEVKVKLRIRYILKDLQTNKILLEIPNQQWTEEYTVNSSSSTNETSEDEALDTIIDDICKRIYQRTIAMVSQL
ncbi:LptE family protein [Desulforhopalus vacuolatus]|uniref:LPS assembly lipoprotein LptE n=1 Tax=Desulforhopalus vacuolatus TaxID=40414 RepID=UPI001962B199|nr:LptE family protein [Desulforhopalus vacuolatus]